MSRSRSRYLESLFVVFCVSWWRMKEVTRDDDDDFFTIFRKKNVEDKHKE